MYVEQFLNTVAAGQVRLLLDQTSEFLLDPDKEGRLQRMGKRADPALLSQYKLLDDHIPIVMSDDFDVLTYLVEQNLAIASVIGTGGEIVSTRGGKLIKFEGDFLKIAIGHDWDERTQKQMLKFRKYLSGDISKTFVDMLYGSVDDLQPRAIKTGNVLTWQVLQFGEVNYTDPRSGITARLTYDTLPALFPSALTGTAKWDQYATANGVQDLEDHLQAFYDENGYYPDKVVMSNRLVTHLGRQESTRNRALSMGMLSNVPAAGVASAVSGEMIKRLIPQLAMSNTQLEIYDAQYHLEIAPGQIIKGRYLNDDTYCFLSAGIGQRLWGPTIENEGKPGLFVKTEELKSSPPQDRSYCVGQFVPFFPDPKKLGARKVA